MSLNKLKETVFTRIPVDIFLVHEAIGIYMAVSENADFLNESGYRQLFGIIQRQAVAEIVNSLCKLFEKRSNKYPNFSIPTALYQLQENLSEIMVPSMNEFTLGEYIRSEIDASFDISDPVKLDSIIGLLYAYFYAECPQVPPRPSKKMDMSLDALKVLRDKRIDHHEDHDLTGLSTTDFAAAIELLCFAQTFVNVIGYQLFGSSQSIISLPDEFLPERSDSGRQMKKLIQTLLPNGNIQANKHLLDSEQLSKPEHEGSWLDEAERRAQEIDAGLVPLISADEVSRKARELLR